MSKTADDATTPVDLFAQWREGWRTLAEASGVASETWSSSVLPLLLSRALENQSGLGAGNEIAMAIERMTQGPRLADATDFDRKLIGALAAWTEMQSKLAAYQVVAMRPWARAADAYREAGAGDDSAAANETSWRDWLSKWTAIANDELILNQRSDEFLAAQRELLKAGTAFRTKQAEIAETVSRTLGVPTQSDFDDVTRQLTELRREVRALARQIEVAASDGQTGAKS